MCCSSARRVDQEGMGAQLRGAISSSPSQKCAIGHSLAVWLDVVEQSSSNVGAVFKPPKQLN
jgi:hypothetical protein